MGEGGAGTWREPVRVTHTAQQGQTPTVSSDKGGDLQMRDLLRYYRSLPTWPKVIRILETVGRVVSLTHLAVLPGTHPLSVSPGPRTQSSGQNAQRMLGAPEVRSFPKLMYPITQAFSLPATSKFTSIPSLNISASMQSTCPLNVLTV